MPSILPGFEYDIFIPYRHKDNRSGWVTEFVNALKTELESTFKEDISVYFDSNPHDGLLETHNIDKSLEGKLKCLIFIPILSQTYCDPKSFAWQHEFCSFNKLAKEDRLGRDIKLNNGNVASRILPIKIHDQDTEDRVTIENEIGGVLRAIEFVFTSVGVSRPLRSNEDHPNDNQSKTFYRDQINKVARASKELISAMQHPVESVQTAKALPLPFISQRRKRVSLIAAGLFIFGLFTFSLYYFVGWGKRLAPVTDNSIAVLYFDNISSDPEQDYFSDGITEEITAHLSSIKGLRVTSRTSVIPYKGKGKGINIRDIASQLNVNTVLEGSVRKSGGKLRITAQLIDARSDQHIWTEVYDRDLTDVFKIQSEIAQAIANKFKIIISKEANEKIVAIPTTNVEAYELYLKAKSIPWPTGQGIGTYYGETEKAKILLRQAIALDPDYAQANVLMSEVFWFVSTHAQLADTKNKKPNYDSAEFYAKEAILRIQNLLMDT